MPSPPRHPKPPQHLPRLDVEDSLRFSSLNRPEARAKETGGFVLQEQRSSGPLSMQAVFFAQQILLSSSASAKTLRKWAC